MKSREDIDLMNPNELVAWFMMGSYLYYIEGTQIMSDPDFDYLVQRLKTNWDNSDHPNKKYITQSHLDASTGYDIPYPSIVKYASLSYIKELQNESR